MTFSDRLRDLMKRNDYTQAYLADRLNTSQQTISRWVNGKFQPDLNQLVELSVVFNVSVDYLLGKTSQDIHKTQPPVISDDELRAWAVQRVSTLSDPALVRVKDFLTGLEAGQDIRKAQAAAPDPDDESSG